MNGYREDHERYHKHGRSTDDEPLAAAAIPDNPGYPHDYGQACSCAECSNRILAAEHAAILGGRIADYGSHASGCPPECPYRSGASLADNLDGVAPHIPGTDYYDGRDGSIEAEDDDEDRIEAEDEARREEWSEFLSWQRDMGA